MKCKISSRFLSFENVKLKRFKVEKTNTWADVCFLLHFLSFKELIHHLTFKAAAAEAILQQSPYRDNRHGSLFTVTFINDNNDLPLDEHRFQR